VPAKDCESLALGMDKVDMTSETEKEMIGEIFANAIEPLSDDDKSLPQVIVVVVVVVLLLLFVVVVVRCLLFVVIMMMTTSHSRR
jgi:superfamily II RNA helicase